MRLVQTVWTEGVIPRQLQWVTVVLIPKGGGGYRGIGLLEPIWKCLEVIMDKRLGVVVLHDCLHGYLPKKGTGTAIMEAKLAQQLACLEQVPLYGIFIDLRKAFDAMDRGRCLAILTAYGAGPRMTHLIREFWRRAELACRAEGNFGRPFKAHRGVTQGGPLSPKFFLILTDAIVREWLREVFGDDVAARGFTATESPEAKQLTRLFVALFFADDGYIASRDPDLLERAIGILSGLFERVGLRTNTTKTEAMICTPGKIRTRLSGESYTRRYAGYGSAREWARRDVACYACGARLRASSLANHLEVQHDIIETSEVGEEFLRPPGREGTIYRAAPTVAGQYHCPVDGCVGEAPTPWCMRRHFATRHPWDNVYIPSEGMYPRCTNYGMQTNPTTLSGGKHNQSKFCQFMGEKWRQQERRAAATLAQRREFHIYGDKLKRVEKFKYLGRWLSQDDGDARAVRAQLVKARRVWARLGNVLRSKNAPPRTCGVFYRAVVQAVLLYGSESWCLGPALLRRVEGFHIRCAIGWRGSAGRREIATETGSIHERRTS